MFKLSFNHRLRSSVICTLLVVSACASAQSQPKKGSLKPVVRAAVTGPSQNTPLRWSRLAVGMADTGTHSWQNGKLTISGAGGALNLKDSDAYQGVAVERAAGDFEVVARLQSFDGAGEASVGIMVRGGSKADSNMTCLSYKAGNNTLHWMSRVPGLRSNEKLRLLSSGIKLAKQGGQPVAATVNATAPETLPATTTETVRWPLWLRMVRIGKNFAVYKSRDGRFWAPISNVSGGPIALNGPLHIGLFATGNGPTDTSPVTAVFDSISIGPPRLAYKTSWVGNTFGSRDDDGHVSNGLSAMWVAPDGTCYTSAYWDEGGEPAKAYRDGKVLHGLPIGMPQTNEGAITGDNRYLYLATNDRITALDRNAPDYAPRPLPLSVNLFNKTKDSSVVSGLASNGKELYVSDSRDNVIRVATLEPLKTFYRVDAANNGVKIADQTVELPAGDARLAPAIVYQTQRVGEGDTYIIPDLKPGASYTARCHLAEFNKKEPQYRGISINYNAGDNSINVQELAGGMFKAYIQDFPNLKANAEGKASIGFNGRPFGLCALEIFDDQQKRVFAVNCGGPPVGDFKGESEELVDRAWKFERPGPMALDKRGDLWIVQCGNDFPLGTKMDAKYKAAIKCYKTDGTFTGKQITDVVNPRALGYDPIRDQLLVGENGPDLNVRVYSGLESTPSLMRTIGQKGGVYAGENPGLINDVAAGGYARFAGVAGVGVDAKGNTYVGGGFQGTDLRQITPEGKLGWMVNSLMFCNTYDFDPLSDVTQLIGTYNHLKLDLAQKQPGKEQKYVSYNWDVRSYGEADRAGGSQAIVRRLGPDKRRVMYTSGQGNIGDIKIFRYDRYLSIPCGAIRSNDIWIDNNGDGKEQPEEVSKMPSVIGWVTTVVVDARGDIYVGCPTTGGSFYRRFFFKGFNDKGVPLYRATQGDGFEDTRFPEEGDKTNAWGMAVRMDYDVERDIMVAFYPAVKRTGEGDKTPPQYFFARYDNWSKGNRVPKWKVKAFTPYTHPDYFMYETDLYPYSGYMGMQVAGDYVFFAYLFGEVHVFDLKTGKLAQIFSVGPEMNGQCAWEDATMGLRASKTKAGEYLVLTENSGWGGKNNFFRWKP